MTQYYTENNGATYLVDTAAGTRTLVSGVPDSSVWVGGVAHTPKSAAKDHGVYQMHTGVFDPHSPGDNKSGGGFVDPLKGVDLADSGLDNEFPELASAEGHARAPVAAGGGNELLMLLLLTEAF